MTVTPEKDWGTLLAKAVVGVDSFSSQEFELIPFITSLSNFSNDTNNPGQPQEYFLRTAAIVNTYLEAGKSISQTLSPTQPDRYPEERSRCSPRAAVLLVRALSENLHSAVDEWLQLAAQKNLRPPEELLPALLNWGTAQKDDLSILVDTLGPRAVWLSGQNPDWTAFFLANLAFSSNQETLFNTWESEIFLHRLTLMRHIRIKRPAFARELIKLTWEQDSAKEKAAFLTTFEPNVDQEDEPFLETALEDRSKVVRRTVVDLLAKIPHSQLVQCMSEKLKQHLAIVKSGLLKRTILEINLPEACDQVMQRYGIEPKPPEFLENGQNAWWLEQILSLVPPGILSQEHGVQPSELAGAASQSEWKESLFKGWISATIRFQDESWSEMLLGLSPHETSLIGNLTDAKCELIILKRLSSNPPDGLMWLASYKRPWQKTFTRKSTHKIIELLHKPEREWNYIGLTQVSQAMQTLGNYAEVTTAWNLISKLSEKPIEYPFLKKQWNQLIDLLDFRRSIHEEFSR
jgi:hypothetical protein